MYSLSQVTEKTQQLHIRKTDAILEVYTDRFVDKCEGDIDAALLWVINQDLSEFSVSSISTN